ncbi:MAG: hypothetical protein JO139_01490 [Alphaproteobacteria bacterium]|nr:hypothetical protein [Alphaproteobacteria bacterium]
MSKIGSAVALVKLVWWSPYFALAPLARVNRRMLYPAASAVSIAATLMMPDYTNRDISQEHA